jgi:hypothetical protein
MYDMLYNLESHKFAPQGEGRLVVVATRHEDGTWGADSLEYHRQRGRLLRSLAGAEGVAAVELSKDVDAEYACEPATPSSTSLSPSCRPQDRSPGSSRSG